LDEIEPSFSTWFEEDVEKAVEEGRQISEEVRQSSKLPSLQARKFKSMYAYGYHFRVKSAKRNSKSTFDSGVAAIFRQPCRFWTLRSVYSEC